MVKALDYIAHPKKQPACPVCVLHGGEPFLKRQALLCLRHEVLGEDDGDFSFTSFDGKSATLHDVLEEVGTVAMFGGDKRLVIVDSADKFVTEYRPDLEDYVAKPSASGVLVLNVETWPANTRLAKAVSKTGLPIDCKAPGDKQISIWLSWLTKWAKQAHKLKLDPAAADALLDMVGLEFGLLDQELAKLSLSADADGRITIEDVKTMVGTWRAKTTWVMIDATLAGNVGEAMQQLDRLLLAGEHPIAILGQISASLRRLAAATRLILQSERSGRRTPLPQALQQAGVQPFLLKKYGEQLRRLGRQRGDQLYRWLLKADLDMKGASALPPRLVLERLIIRLASKQERAAGVR